MGFGYHYRGDRVLLSWGEWALYLPFSLGIFARCPAYGGKFVQGSASNTAAFLERVRVRQIRPGIAAKRVQLHAPGLAVVDPAA